MSAGGASSGRGGNPTTRPTPTEPAAPAAPGTGAEPRAQAATVLSKLIVWAEAQFQAMGRPDARELGVALVAAYQGIALVANTLRDPGLVAAEGARLERWIDQLAASA